MRFRSFRDSLLYIALATRLFATTYYVDYENGTDVNSGTSAATPWQHCPGDPAAEAYAAACALAPGDTVYFKGGVTYLFTGPSGIMLHWDGSADRPITYDGNSIGAWGEGRAKFTDRHSSNAITAFLASGPRRHLVFSSLEIGPMGGAPSLPPDLGFPLSPKFGGGIAFHDRIEHVTIDACDFRELGYWFNQRPMTGETIYGAGIQARGACQNVAISNCSFSRMRQGCDLSSAYELSQVSISDCTFRDSVVSPIDLPSSASGVSIYGCTEIEGGQFSLGAWTGYGSGPLVERVTAVNGGYVTFSASATASPAASFQWCKDGLPLPNATQATLTLSALSLNDAGIYTAIAANAAGSTMSNPIVLEVASSAEVNLGTPDSPAEPSSASPPVFVTQPLSQIATLWGTAVFNGAAAGTPEPAYQWIKDGRAIPGWTSSSLVFAGVSSNDVATYMLVATNSAGTAYSRPVTLSVMNGASGLDTGSATGGTALVPPVFTTQPASQTAASSTTVTFSVSATGTPAPTYQWRKNGVDVPGWTSATLVLTSVTSNDAATYTAVANNSAGTAFSQPVSLSVADGVFVNGGTSASDPGSHSVAPVFTTQPSSQIAAGSTTVTFSVKASGTPLPTYQWQKNGVNVPGWTSPTLVLTSVTPNDSAAYTAMASNSAGAVASQSAGLMITDATPTQVSKVLVSTQMITGLSEAHVTFVVDGGSAKRVLIRALGPALASLGLQGGLPNPRVALYRDNTVLQENDDWGGGSALRDSFNEAGAVAIPDSTSLDAALLVTLPPGPYTVIVAGSGNTVGIVLAEVYQLP